MGSAMTSSGQPLSVEFKAAAKSGNYTEAFNRLSRLPVVDGLVSCLELAETDLPAFSALADKATQKEKAQFVARLVKDGFIPPDLYSGVSDIEYHFARTFILRARAEKKRVVESLWPKAESIAKSKAFYPEMARGQSARNRICAAAEKHVDIGPFDGRQIALFSLGGFYDFNAAKAATKPQKGATTCILFARAVLHAAGCNVIGPHTLRGSSIVGALFNELPKSTFGFVAASELDGGRGPQQGDIFQIRGDNFKDKEGKPTTIDSTHVGIVLHVVGDSWTTIEGGGGEHVTRRTERKLVAVKSPHGKWAFEKDATSAGVRPLQGWFDIDRISPGQWMI